MVLPWGSLLAAVALPRPEVLRGIRALCQPGARLTVAAGQRSRSRPRGASTAGDSLAPAFGARLSPRPRLWRGRLHAHGGAGPGAQRSGAVAQHVDRAARPRRRPRVRRARGRRSLSRPLRALTRARRRAPSRRAGSAGRAPRRRDVEGRAVGAQTSGPIRPGRRWSASRGGALTRASARRPAGRRLAPSEGLATDRRLLLVTERWGQGPWCQCVRHAITAPHAPSGSRMRTQDAAPGHRRGEPSTTRRVVLRVSTAGALVRRLRVLGPN